MKSNYFISTIAIVLIAHFITWFILIATTIGQWWRKCLNFYCQRWQQELEERRQRRRQQLRQYRIISSDHNQQQQKLQPQQGDHPENQNNKMYQFRPFEVVNCNYKSYSRSSKGRGINIIPKARSGHRIAANEVDLFSFGGKFYNLYETNSKLSDLMFFFLFVIHTQVIIQIRTVIYSKSC